MVHSKLGQDFSQTKYIKLHKNEYERNEFSFVEEKLKNLT